MPLQLSPHHFHSRRGGAALVMAGALVFAAAVILIVWTTRKERAQYRSGRSTAPSAEMITNGEETRRQALYQEAVAAGIKQADTWPSTPEALIRDFWLAASQKDYDRLTLLCPGAAAEEFKGYYDQYPPSPATTVGPPEPHPMTKNVQLYPVIVPFPGYPRKTIKMALFKTDEGRLVVDGQHTIWW